MNFKKSVKTTQNSLSFVGLSLAVTGVVAGLFFVLFPAHRQYSPGISITKNEGDGDDDKDALGMAQYFFAARKNIHTNSMDYADMIASDIADRAMNKKPRTHAPSGLPQFTWNSLGPTSTGGRTRAILIDQNDPTHQTIFAGGVSGGIWKSTNGGGTWGNDSAAICFSLNDNLQNINVSCIAQDANGAIYIGTGEGFTVYSQGEGFSTGMLGGGIFKSTDDGNTWRLLTSTVPKTNNDNTYWAYVNRIAIRPDNFKVIYAATDAGLMVSHDSGATWNSAFTPSGAKLAGIISGSTYYSSLDVKISNDGSVVIACIGESKPGGGTKYGTSTIDAYGYYCYPQSGLDSVFTEIPSSGAGYLGGDASRIEFAISPTDANRIYASVVAATGEFGTDGAGSGIFMTENAKTNGGYWYDIGPGGSASFDPYVSSVDQAGYDNTLGVLPANEGELLAGGTTLWEWTQLSPTDTLGAWNKISHYQPYYNGDPFYIHPDEHTIVFDQNNPATLYMGTDGGVFKCTNMVINPSNIESSIENLVFNAVNRNYNVTQYFTVCFTSQPNNDTVKIANGFNSTVIQHELLDVGGGTQDNGSPYVNGSGYYPNDGTDMSGGDGGGCAISSLNPNIAYFCADYGSLERTGNLGALSFPTSAYTETIGDSLGADIDSVWNLAYETGDVSFVMPVALYENAYDTLNHDSLLYTATQTYSAGATIYPQADNGPTYYPYVLPVNLDSGASLEVPDRVVSRLAIGFSPYYGIWINGQGASDNTVVWMPIAGPNSTPTPYVDPNVLHPYDAFPIHSLAWSSDGDVLFAGSEDGVFFRFTNINSIIANKYSSGALYYQEGGIHNTTNQVVSANLTFGGTQGRDILSISVDPQNANNVLLTLGNYGESEYVFYSSNALATTPTFIGVQGNLPDMPVYGSVLDLDSAGTWHTNSAMIATEHGIYTTNNITASPVVWTKNNSGMANCLTLAIKQQTLPEWKCTNSGNIYVGTHGRGLWSSSNYYRPQVTAIPNVVSSSFRNGLLVYPNPMTNEGTIQYTLASAGNVTITIFDLQGRQIKNLFMDTQSPGTHNISFESGALSAGVYFVSLTGDNFRKVSKFIVAR